MKNVRKEVTLKRRNVMRNSVQQLCGAVLLAAAFVFAGCSDLADGAKNAFVAPVETAENAKVCMVSGKVSVGGKSGAISSAFLAGNSDFAGSRSATSSLTVAEDDTCSVYAYKGTVVEPVSGTSVDGTYDKASGTYSIPLNRIGPWVICVNISSAGAGSPKLSGCTEVAVSDDYAPVSDQTVVLQPVYGVNEADAGSVSLTITDSTTGGKIKSVAYDGRILSTGSGNANSFESMAAVNFADGVAEIKASSVRPNSYEVTFRFYDAENGEGNMLYKCKETVTVFSGFSTDTWFGLGSHLSEDNDTVVFKITDELVSAFGTETVQASEKVLVYDYELGDGSSKRFNYYLVDEDKLGTDGESTSRTSIGETAFVSYPNDFSAFDSEGNIYLFQKTENGFVLHSSKTGWSPIGLSEDDLGLAALREASKFDGDVRGFAIDRKTDAVYLIHDKNGVEVVKWPNLISSSGSDATTVTFELAEGEFYLPENAVVYDGKIYLTVRQGFLIFDAKDATEGASNFTPKILQDWFPSGMSGNAYIADMMYQDGAVYMLVNDNKFSRGALLRYDTLFGTVKTIINSSGQAPECSLYGYNASAKQLYTDSDLTNRLVIPSSVETVSDTLPRLHAAAAGAPVLEFFGPRKFLAVKPKKLVIADDGLAFYVADGFMKYKNSNRVITVDLEKFAITDAVNTGVCFDGDASGLQLYSTPSTTAFLSEYGNTTMFYDNGEAEPGQTFGSSIKFGFSE